MFGPSVEEDFVNAATARPARGAARRGLMLLVVLAGGLGAFLWWAATFEIEETTRAMGRVVPAGQVQVVQAPDAGVVRELLVREGDVVAQAAPLVRIDDTAAGAERGELLEREAALMAEELRLRAEAEAGDLDFPDDLTARAPLAVEAERAVFTSRATQFANELRVLDDQLAQRRAERAETQATIAKLEGQVGPLREEVAITGPLAERGAVTQVDFLRLQTRLAEIEGELGVTRARITRIEAGIREAETQIATARSAYVLTARERLARVSGELSVLRETLRAAQDRVSRTTLAAPVAGTVNRVHVATVGAVVSPGAPLVEIVPADDHLKIEARLRPQDVAFIRPGDPASVKITAYDYVVYGALAGTVERIGADAITEGEETFFQVTLRTDRTSLTGRGQEVPVGAGMVAQVDIQTGRKTVLDYLLNPFLRAGNEALRER